jgi:hypothetical protein
MLNRTRPEENILSNYSTNMAGAASVSTSIANYQTERRAHLLLQVRTKVLNENWRSTLSRWYPGMEETRDAKAA